MTAPTKENLGAVPAAPREPKGTTVGESSSAAAAPPRIRGYAPPIIDSAPATPAPAPSSAPVKLPRLWLAFHSDGKALYCTGALQRDHVQRVRFDPNDPIVGQAYAFFVRQMVLMLDSGQALPEPPAEPAPVDEPAPVEPAPAEPAAPAEPPAPAPDAKPESVPLAELKTKRESPSVSAGGTTVLRRNQVQRLEAESEDVVPPTNRTNPKPAKE